MSAQHRADFVELLRLKENTVGFRRLAMKDREEILALRERVARLEADVENLKKRRALPEMWDEKIYD